MTEKKRVVIDVVSDILWPWCWIGKRKMEAAMDMLSSEYEFRVRWEPYLLRPQTPPEGLPIPASYKDPNNPRWVKILIPKSYFGFMVERDLNYQTDSQHKENLKESNGAFSQVRHICCRVQYHMWLCNGEIIRFRQKGGIFLKMSLVFFFVFENSLSQI